MTMEELKKENKTLKYENKLLINEREGLENKIRELQKIITQRHEEIKLLRKRLGIKAGPHYGDDKQ